MSKNKKTILLIVGILLVISLITGISYALWTVTRTQTDTNIVESGCFSMELVTGAVINLETEFPITDEEGLQTEPFHFTIENTCDTDASVEIKLLAMNETTMGLDHVKLALDGVVSIQPTIIDSLTDTTTTTSGVKIAKTLKTVQIAGGDTREFDLRLWIDESVTKEEESSTKFVAKIEIDGSATVNHLYADHSGANAPELNNGLIPVVYQNNKWIKADVNNEWYDYDAQWWANAVTVKEANRSTYTAAEPGTEISMEDINTMWVWIPRYSYTIKSEDGTHYYGNLNSDYIYCKDIESPDQATYPNCYEYEIDEANKAAFQQYWIDDYGMSESEAKEVAEILYHNKFENIYYGYTLKQWLDNAGITYQETFQGDNIANYSVLQPAAIDIKFANGTAKETGTAQYTGNTTNNWLTHPAFTFGTQELTGMWVAKFELSTGETTCTVSYVSEDGCDFSTIKPTILPSVASWRGARVGTFFTAIQENMNGSNGTTTYGFSNSDTHMMKNSEWGAVAYLSQSKYGKHGSSSYTGTSKEVAINNCETYITGVGGDTVSANPSSTTCTTNTYETIKGQTASTTGNIYGIYDMSGGSWEYVMGNMKDAANTEPMIGESASYNSGFSGKLYDGTDYTGTYGYLKDINTKYYDQYAYYEDATGYGLNHSRGILGDATKETDGWYVDSDIFVDSCYPWFLRGGFYNDSNIAGLFYFFYESGYADDNYSARAVLVSTVN